MLYMYVNTYKGAGGNKNVYITVDDGRESGTRIEVKEGETLGSVIDRFLEANFTEKEIW